MFFSKARFSCYAGLEPAASETESQIAWPRSANEFANHLHGQIDELRCIISKYLRPGQHCEVSDSSEWRYGSYNVCIPVAVTGPSAQRLALKCPLPHRFRGRYDLMDEKIRCEAGAFVWISQNCTRVPIPKLWGFGLPTGLNVSSLWPIGIQTDEVCIVHSCWAFALVSTCRSVLGRTLGLATQKASLPSICTLSETSCTEIWLYSNGLHRRRCDAVLCPASENT